MEDLRAGFGQVKTQLNRRDAVPDATELMRLRERLDYLDERARQLPEVERFELSELREDVRARWDNVWHELGCPTIFTPEIESRPETPTHGSALSAFARDQSQWEWDGFDR